MSKDAKLEYEQEVSPLITSKFSPLIQDLNKRRMMIRPLNKFKKFKVFSKNMFATQKHTRRYTDYEKEPSCKERLIRLPIIEQKRVSEI
mmetsp:Transcript_5146/g.6071  ORF Transcript_5146/g.6071 Transcript_5146/m.6071 type:complete len:89 (-) Transcript_5146:52-318(-)